jgi:1-acyl-sn-glycerol-3-phosphate acyltransferase
MKYCYRYLQVLFWLVTFFGRAWFIRLTTPNHVLRRKRFAANTSYIGRKLLKPFGLHVRITNPELLPVLSRQNHLIVANHVSYTDIIVLSSLHPFVFITSQEMAANAVLGDITRLGGSLFTDRKKHTTLPQEIRNFADALQQGLDVVLFPEGTSTDGRKIYDFRKSLFQTSISAQKPILPIFIRYRSIDGKPMDDSNRDLVCWYGEMFFLPHYNEIIRHRIEVEVTILAEIPYSTAQNRGELSETVHSLLSQAFVS